MGRWRWRGGRGSVRLERPLSSMGNQHCAHTAVQWMVWPGSPPVRGPHGHRRAVTPDGEEIHDEVRVPSA